MGNRFDETELLWLRVADLASTVGDRLRCGIATWDGEVGRGIYLGTEFEPDTVHHFPDRNSFLEALTSRMPRPVLGPEAPLVESPRVTKRRAGGPRVVLVMADYLAEEDLPIWQMSHDDIGFATTAWLENAPQLAADLKTWNDKFESIMDNDFEFASMEEEVAHRVEAFNLAARLQAELGNEFHVWCGAGGRVGRLDPSDGESVVVLAASDPGATVLRWTRDEKRKIRASLQGVSDESARAIVAWRGITGRTGTPFGDASTRTLGLQVAARMQADVDQWTKVVFFAGVGSRDDYSNFF